MPTGTLANHLAIRTLCGDKPRAIVQEQSHLYNDTGDSTTRLSGINLVPLAKDLPCFTVDDVKSIIHKSEGGRVSNQVGALLIDCLLYTSPSPRDLSTSRMPSSA